jgi:hypothetical protein
MATCAQMEGDRTDMDVYKKVNMSLRVDRYPCFSFRFIFIVKSELTLDLPTICSLLSVCV